MPDQPRIALGGILTECNHFGGTPIDLAVYEACELFRGDELLEQRTSVLGGMLAGLREGGGEPRPSLFASACAGGPITADCYAGLRADLFQRMRQALPVEGVLLPLHGSALVDGLDDPEGDLIQATRDLVGPRVPIVATLDLHAHVTEAMVQGADALLAWETYPHHDQFATGRRAARLLLDAIAGRCRPTMAMGKAPVITSAIHGSTEGDDPFADMMRYAKSLERQDAVISTSMFLIHPYMDCEGMGSGGLVVTDNDTELARFLAEDLARRYWDRRFDLEPKTWKPGEAIAQAMQLNDGPVLLVETADCCGGGAAGDSIATLSALVDADASDAIAPLVDPEAAAACHAAGIGAAISLPLGHKIDPRWGESRVFSGVVETLSDGEFVYAGGQWESRREQMGLTAVLRIGGTCALIMSRPTYDWADEQIRSVGLDPARQKFLVVKNPMNYRQAYGAMAKAIFVLDTPGPTPATLKHHHFEKLQRPFFPHDQEIPGWRPTILS